ncbi:MAG TPA: hypothetical protein VF802_01265 [Candidatus Limnocylindrales bacterium]
MSRRVSHGGRPGVRPYRRDERPRAQGSTASVGQRPSEPRASDLPGPVPRLIASAEELAAHPVVEPPAAVPAVRAVAAPPLPAAASADGGAEPPGREAGPPGGGSSAHDAGETAHDGEPARGTDRTAAACTPAQMRRFIKSRPWVPLHELRRRFQIDGTDDDVIGVELQLQRVFVGLPAREGQILGDLLRSGEIGYELSLDPATPVVIGVYPMRPVVRT